jgi:hypothetical protein
MISVSEIHGCVTSVERLRKLVGEAPQKAPSRAEVIESLAFLERNRCVELYKWCDVTVGFRAYRDDPSDQTSFFRGEFWIVPTGAGRRLMLEREQ